MEQIRLDIIPKGLMPVCHSSQYDKGRVIRLNLVDGLQGYTLTDETVTLNVRKPDNNIVTAGLNVVSGASYVDIVTTEQMTACEGENLCEIVITKGDVKIASLNFKMKVEVDPLKDGIESESVIHNLESMVDGMVAEDVAEQYDSSNVIFDDEPTEGHGNGYTVTSEGIGNAIDNALDMTDTASGAIATFESEYALPLRNLEIEINAVQESGTPTPSSPKAISGFTGANITQAPVYERVIATTPNTQTADGITVTTKANGLIEVNGTANANGTITFNCNPFVIPSIEGRTMRLNNSFSGGFTVRFFNGSTEIDYWELKAINRTVTNYSRVGGQTINKIAIAYSRGANVTNGTLLVDFIANSTTTSITWQSEAGTVYGGSLDVTSGVLTVTHARVDLGSLTWNKNTSFTNTLFVANVSDKKTNNSNCLCTNYTNGGIATGGTFLNNLANNNFASDTSNGIYIRDDSKASLSGDDFKTAMSGVYLVYELATPVTYQLTPTQISAIVGTNNVFTDTNGDTSLEYYTKRGEQTVRIAEGVAIDVINNKNIDTLNTTNKTLVGAVNEVNANKANKTQITDYIKIKVVNLLVSDVTRNMNMSSYVSIDSGYKFLCWMPTVIPTNFTCDQAIWMSAPVTISGNPWWHTNPIVGSTGSNARLQFFYLEIKNV